MSDKFQIIGGYDMRRNTSTIASSDAHAMVKASNPKVSKPRKPKAYTLDQILDRALTLGVKVEMASKQFTFYPPKFDDNGNQVGHNYGEYMIATKATARQALDEIAVEIVKAKSDAAIAVEAEQAISDLLPPVVAICDVEAEQAYQELQPVAAPVVERRFYERTSYLGIGVEVYCGDERYGYALAELLDRPIEVDYTLERQRMEQALDRDSDRAANFAMSARYGCGALI